MHIPQGFGFPKEWTAVAEYMKQIESRDSWKKTAYGTDAIIAGWKRHLGIA